MGTEIGEGDLDLATATGVDDAREGGQPLEGEAGAVFDERAIVGGSSRAMPVGIWTV